MKIFETILLPLARLVVLSAMAFVAYTIISNLL